MEETSGQGDSVLGKFLGILGTYGLDAMADGGMEAGSDFVAEQLTSLGGT